MAVLKYYGNEFYVPEDDDDLDSSDPFDKPPIDNVVPSKQLSVFVFSDYTFARQVRARMWEMLIPFDEDKNFEFS